MKKYVSWFIFSLLLIIAFSFLVYPTPYHYTHTNVRADIELPVKINRITGDAYTLFPTGWEKVEDSK